jgi:nitrate reductase gamma subunit
MCVNRNSEALTEIHMYIGGILGTVILIALIVWVVRRV